MGTSYEGLLVIGARAMVVEVLAAERLIAVVADVGPDRIAVIPDEDQLNGADHTDIAECLSRAGGRVLAHAVADSDTLFMSVYDDGRLRHDYVSEMANIGTPQETDAGLIRVINGVAYTEDDPNAPRGPHGADPEPFLRFGIGDIDRHELRRLLRSAPNYVFADDLHHDILTALNLATEPMTTSYRQLENLEVGLADAVWVPEHYRPEP